MSRHATDFQECVASPPLPADHVLNSAAVLFPGAFDQHGCPLIVFPVEEQAKLSSELSKAEVVDFINYFLCLHNKRQEKESLVSVVADLRSASPPTTRVIAETLLLLELHKRTVHSVYIIQPKKKDVVRLFLKTLAPSRSYTASFKKVLLKEISELSNYIDRSQLTASLGGYLIYCHHSWVAFIKEIDEFVQDFLSVVQRLPSCISTLQTLSRLPLPSTFTELQHFCSINEAKFQQLRRELGLDELLSHCERVVEKLRHPEKDSCYQAMAGTALFTHTAFDMLQNHSRITAAVEKVELLWQQAFSKARLQLQVFQLREDALQITEQIKTLLEEKLQPYKIQISKDPATAVMLVSEFEASVHTPAMALIGCAEDVVHTVAEILLVEGQTRERWVLDLDRLKDKLHSAVHFILQTLRAVSSYHHHYNKASSWYSRVHCENVLQVLLSGVNGDEGSSQRHRRNWGTVPNWRHKVSSFLKKNPPPDVEELVHLAHLAKAIPDDEVHEAGKQMSKRCMTLRKLLVCAGPVAVGHLQLALQWQYEMLRSSQVNRPSDGAPDGSAQVDQDSRTCDGGQETVHLLRTSAVSGTAEAKAPSLSSFDSGFDGAGSSQLEALGGRDGVDRPSRLAGTRNSVRPATSQPQVKNLSGVSDGADPREESSRASIQIIPKVTVDSLNLEITVKRSAALPNNPWLSLPVDDLENSYTVIITQNPTPHKTDLQVPDPSEPGSNAESSRSNSSTPTRPQTSDWTLHSQSSLEDPELSPMVNILSSTITDGREESTCTTEGIPTLLWDSYDLHDQNQEAVDGVMDISLTDWDVKEQEGLMEVEKILDRADEILEKEENVLAQEAVLDALLRSEDRQWPLWAPDHQLSVMSSSELAEAGVLGLEDYLDPAESDHLSDSRPGSAIETKASEDDGLCSGADTGASHSSSDLLMELREVHILDELIMEENLKIQELRSCKEEELSVGKPPDTNGTPSRSKEREAFRLQLEKEKREVEKLERSLDKERNVKKHKDRRVVTCSVMEKARTENKEDQALCDKLLSGNRSTSLLQKDSQDSCKTVPAVLGPDVAPQDLELLPDSQHQDDCSGAEPPVFNLVTLNSSSDLKEAPEEEEPLGCIYGENASVTAGTRPDDGAFDPGGTSHLPPVPKPRKTLLPVKNNLTKHEPPHSSELLNPAPSSGDQDLGFVQLDGQDEPPPENVTPIVSHDVVLSLHVKEQSNNNNNHTLLEERSGSSQLLERTTECRPDPSCSPQTDLQAADQLPPDQLLEFDPGGEDEQDEDLMLHGDQSSESMRISGSGSAGDQSSESMRISGPESAGVQSSESMRISGSGSAGDQSSESMRISGSGSAGVQSSESMRISGSGSAGDQSSESMRISGSGSAGVQCSGSMRISGSGSAGDQSSESMRISGSGSAGDQSSESMRISGSGSAGDQSSESMRISGSGSAGVQSSESMRISGSGSAGDQSSESMRISGSGSAGDQSSESMRISGSGSAGDQSSESMRISGSESAGDQSSGSMRISGSESAGDQSSGSMRISGSESAGVQRSESMRISGSESAGDQSFGSMRISGSGSVGDQSSGSMRISGSGSVGDQSSGSMRISGSGSAGDQSSESMRISGSGSAGVETQLNINMREMTDCKTPIVLDTGSGLMKAGFADRDLPSVIFPTVIGTPKYEEIMNGNLERETYIGHGAQHMRGVLALKHPIKNGIIRNWDEMEKIWHHTFQQLRVDPDDHPVLLTEAAMNPRENRQRMVEIMFECFGVPFTYVAMQAVLALYASGRSTGVVIDSGDGVSHSVPVFEGYCLPHSVQRFPLAGVDVTMHLKKLLQEQGVNMRSTAELEIVREMKERCCYVALDYEAELSQAAAASCREMHYTMPDGQIVSLSTERFRAPEILFKPELIGRDHYGMHESVFKSILSSDIDLRSCFLGNIVLSGGNTLLSGFPERLQAEIKGLVPTNMGDSVRVSSPKDRVFSVWSGGAVLASLPSFSAAWISQEEYEECGPQIVFRKCF